MKIRIAMAFVALVGPAQAEEKKLTKSDLAEVRSCLSGWMSKSAERDPKRDIVVRGNIATLDQRKPSLSCPEPDSNVIAFTETVDSSNAETTLIDADGHVRRYRIPIDSLQKGKTLEVPDFDYSCQNGSLFSLGEGGAKAPFRMRLSTWNAHFQTDDAGAFKLGGQLYGHELVDQATDADRLPADKMEKAEALSSGQLTEKLLEQINAQWIRIEDRFYRENLADVKASLKECEAAVADLRKKLPDGLMSYNIGLKAQDTMDRASSILIAPKAGQPTAETFILQEEREAKSGQK